MNNIQRKQLIIQDKKTVELLNEVSSFDETSIIFSGNQDDKLLKKIK